jgi:hypothetical protein
MNALCDSHAVLTKSCYATARFVCLMIDTSPMTNCVMHTRPRHVLALSGGWLLSACDHRAGIITGNIRLAAETLLKHAGPRQTSNRLVVFCTE